MAVSSEQTQHLFHKPLRKLYFLYSSAVKNSCIREPPQSPKGGSFHFGNIKKPSCHFVPSRLVAENHRVFAPLRALRETILRGNQFVNSWLYHPLEQKKSRLGFLRQPF